MNNFKRDLTTAEQQRYIKHLNLEDFGVDKQLKLKHAKVLCIGAGGLGSPLLLYLAAAGVGTIGVVDHDVIDISNLQRQVLYTTEEIGKPKVVIAKNKLQAINSEIKINAYQTQLVSSNAAKLFADYDIITDCTDNHLARFLINDTCAKLKKIYVYASVYALEGHCAVFNAPNGPCYRCLFEEAPPQGLFPGCAVTGILGVVPGVLGVLQAAEVIKLITGVGQPLIGRMLVYNVLTAEFRELLLEKNPRCPLCGK
jgi:sulfur-carrier protein adenylyltransferase/sulfurtransferase